jgi:predicted RNase H-like HicB family nuclease
VDIGYSPFRSRFQADGEFLRGQGVGTALASPDSTLHPQCSAPAKSDSQTVQNRTNIFFKPTSIAICNQRHNSDTTRRCATQISEIILMTSMNLTAIFMKVPEGYVAFIEELPGANTEGSTLDEARENLREAVALVLDTNRAMSEESLEGASVIRETFVLPAT